METEEQPRRTSQPDPETNPIHCLPVELLAQIFISFSSFQFDNRNYRPPVVASHVCQRWRVIALSTPELWSRVFLDGYKNPLPSLQFFTRSGAVSLDIDYRSVSGQTPSTEFTEFCAFMNDSRQVLPRVERFSVQCDTMRPLGYLRTCLAQHSQIFPNLFHLAIAIATPHPSCIEAPHLLPSAMLGEEDAARSTSRLTSLRLEQFPLFNLPKSLVANLRTLELAFSPRKKYGGTWDYFLKMSDVCRFLSATPRLEELILVNTVPYFDVTIPHVDGLPHAPIKPVEPVRLHHLKAIDWSFPFPYDIYRFFSMLDTPLLDKLDIWIDDFPKRVDTAFLRGYPLSTTTKHYSGILPYPCLRELNIQCVSDDFYGLRKFLFSGLESLVLNNVSNLTSNGRQSSVQTPKLLPFPRLESIFRDPRLFNLTRLSLSYFRIPTADDRAESVLNYLPALTSLSLEGCEGVEKLLEVLADTVVMNFASRRPGDSRPSRGVKVCPHLEAMSFWSCPDVDFARLRDVLLARRRSRTGDESLNPPPGPRPPPGVRHLPSPHTTPNVAPKVPTDEVPSVEPTSSTSNPPPNEKLTRKIKPLRRLRRPAPQTPPPSSSPPTDSHMVDLTQRLSSLFSVQDSLSPSSIIYLRVANCRIREVEAKALAELGNLEVVWVGGDDLPDDNSGSAADSNELVSHAASHV